MSNEPARGYSWEPFRPGHELSIKHGAYSPRKVDPKAREIVETLLETGPSFLADPAYAPTLWLFGKTLARFELFSEYLDAQGSEIEDDENERRRDASNKLDRLTKLAADLASKLGLDPSTRAKIERDLAQGRASLAPLIAEGRRFREQAERQARNGSSPDQKDQEVESE